MLFNLVNHRNAMYTGFKKKYSYPWYAIPSYHASFIIVRTKNCEGLPQDCEWKIDSKMKKCCQVTLRLRRKYNGVINLRVMLLRATSRLGIFSTNWNVLSILWRTARNVEIFLTLNSQLIQMYYFYWKNNSIREKI